MVDVILCPAAPGPAPKHGTSKYWHYTSLWNLLDYPGAVFPAGVCDRSLDSASSPSSLLANTPASASVDAVRLDATDSGSGGGFRNEREAEIWQNYDAEDCHGLPVSLQIVARRFEDEKVLRALQLIEGVLQQS